MTIQIAVRVPDELISFIDDAVAEGSARSRTDFVVSAIEAHMRRLLAERDAQILREQPEDELDDLVDWTMNSLQTLEIGE